MDKKSRIGILGGTFNPVHHGHIDLGLKIMEAFKLDKVLYILSAIPPHKKNHDIVDAHVRWQMLTEALSPYPTLEPCDIEMKRRQDSWTIVTIEQLKEKYPGDRLFFISGSEGFLKIRTWKNYKDLLRLLSFIILLRTDQHRAAVHDLLSSEGIPTCPKENNPADSRQEHTCAHLHTYLSDYMHISSTMIRQKVKQSEPIDEFVCSGVQKIMEEKNYMNAEDFQRITEDLKRRMIPTAVKKVVSIMLDKQAERVVVLKLKGISDITDFMVICSGHSSRQNSAVADAVRKVLGKQAKLKPFGVEGQREAEWILMDYIDFVVHIFSEESRKKYSIEKLWMDAKRYDFFIDQPSEG